MKYLFFVPLAIAALFTATAAKAPSPPIYIDVVTAPVPFEKPTSNG